MRNSEQVHFIHISFTTIVEKTMMSCPVAIFLIVWLSLYLFLAYLPKIFSNKNHSFITQCTLEKGTIVIDSEKTQHPPGNHHWKYVDLMFKRIALQLNNNYLTAIITLRPAPPEMVFQHVDHKYQLSSLKMSSFEITSKSLNSLQPKR